MHINVADELSYGVDVICNAVVLTELLNSTLPGSKSLGLYIEDLAMVLW